MTYPVCTTPSHVPEVRCPTPDKTPASLAGQFLTTADLIACQDSSVVSRMPVNKITGTITLFAFDSGEGMSEPTVPFDEIASILDGKQRSPLINGSLLFTQARCPHAGKDSPCGLDKVTVLDEFNHKPSTRELCGVIGIL
jgi:hypothetical protein